MLSSIYVYVYHVGRRLNMYIIINIINSIILLFLYDDTNFNTTASIWFEAIKAMYYV